MPGVTNYGHQKPSAVIGEGRWALGAGEIAPHLLIRNKLHTGSPRGRMLAAWTPPCPYILCCRCWVKCMYSHDQEEEGGEETFGVCQVLSPLI